MTLVTPRIVNNVSCVSRINDECYFSWQAQYLVKCKCHFSWQAQYSVKFGMIAGARNVVFFNTEWRDISFAPRIVTNVSYVMRINHGSHFPWQAQQSVIL